MLRPRIIPCLLVKDQGLVKTVRFSDPKYVGDPINAVRIFNEKAADELIILDIDATVKSRDPDLKTISHWAAECRMPLCYGGGIKTVEQARAIIGLGVEKIAISSAAISNPNLIRKIADEIGSQSVVVVVDVKKHFHSKKYEVFTHNGAIATGKTPLQVVSEAEKQGAGEIVLNSIDNDGLMKGYDFEIAQQLRVSTSVPMTVIGGAGSMDDLGLLIERFGIIGAAAGSMFVFKGPYKAVLISYPSKKEKEDLLVKCFRGFKL